MIKKRAVPNVGEIGYTNTYIFKVLAKDINKIRIVVLDTGLKETNLRYTIEGEECSDFQSILVDPPAKSVFSQEPSSMKKIYLADGYSCWNCKRNCQYVEICQSCGKIICPVCKVCGCNKGIEYGRGISRGLGH